MPGTLDYSRQRLEKVYSELRHLPRVASVIWAAAGRKSLAWIALTTIQGLLPIALVYLSRAFVNSIVYVIQSGASQPAVRTPMLIAASIAAIIVLSELLRSSSLWLRGVVTDLVRDHVADQIQRKSVEIDMRFYDQVEYYDRLHRARSEALFRPTALVEGLGVLLQSVVTMIGMVSVLFAVGPFLGVAIFASFGPAVYVLLRAAERRHSWAQTAANQERRCWYYDNLLTRVDCAAEVRLFDLGKHFRSCYQSVRQLLRRQRNDLARKEFVGELGASLSSVLILGSVLILMLRRAISGTMSYGDIALLFQASNQTLAVGRNVLGSVGQLYENSIFLGDFFDFLDLETSPPHEPALSVSPIKGRIEFDHVSFRYPSESRFVLQDFSMTLEPGRLVAIVGPNGAGKSTILKLLCRFYEPEAGNIFFDGTPLRQIPISQIRQSISVQFQAPVRYSASVRDNIRYGDLLLSTAASDKRLPCAARAAGVDSIIRDLPGGYDCQLGKVYAEGQELSFGQWQRIALARAMFRDAPIIVLDEPTSAMDPWSEIDWAKSFREQVGGKTAILITHRFTTAMFADVVHVVHAGRIVESGTHEELIAKNGFYKKGWSTTRKGEEM